MIEEHLYTTSVDPKIPPIDVVTENFKAYVAEHTSQRSRASEIEYAIRHHININPEHDPVFYRFLSKKLEEILLENENRWGLLEQKLMEMREVNRRKSTAQVGLSTTESPFYSILELRSEVSQVKTHWIIQPNRR